jgi:hypothetical protein
LRRNDAGESKGVAFLGRRTLYRVREGEAASREKEKKASVGRGKAELFPLQGGSGRLHLQWWLQPLLKPLTITEKKMFTIIEIRLKKVDKKSRIKKIKASNG